MVKLMLAPALLMAIQAPLAAAAEDFSGLLNAPVNAIRSCKFVRRADGEHLVIRKEINSEVNEIQIQFYNDESSAAYKYIFSVSAKKPRRFISSNDNLVKTDQFDITLRTAIGFRVDMDKRKIERIFTKNGEYTIYIGYGFMLSDDVQIYGACSVNLEAK